HIPFFACRERPSSLLSSSAFSSADLLADLAQQAAQARVALAEGNPHRRRPVEDVVGAGSGEPLGAVAGERALGPGDAAGLLGVVAVAVALFSVAIFITVLRGAVAVAVPASVPGTGRKLLPSMLGLLLLLLCDVVRRDPGHEPQARRRQEAAADAGARL